MSDTDDIDDRTTLTVVDPAGLEARRGRETLLVTGASRGATSMVAYALLRAGYPLTATADTPHHEDEAFAEARGDRAQLARLIREHDAATARWLKLPHAVYDLTWYAGQLRAPVLMMVYRNPLAIARSVRRRAPRWPQDREGMHRALYRSLLMLTAGTQVMAQEAPAILVDADRAQANPRALVDELIDVLELELPEDERPPLAHAIGTGGYKRT